MKNTGEKLSQNSLQRQRRALTAKIHIAIKDLGIDDDLYRLILREEFGVSSSSALSNRELERLIARFESRGWRPKPSAKNDRARQQAEALKEKVGQMVLHSDLTEKRLRGLVLKICRVHDLRFCQDPRALKALLAALKKIIDGGYANEQHQQGNG